VDCGLGFNKGRISKETEVMRIETPDEEWLNDRIVVEWPAFEIQANTERINDTPITSKHNAAGST